MGGEKKKKKRGRREGEDCWVCLCTPVVVGNLPALPAKPAHILSGFEEEGHETQQGRRENNRTALRPALFLGAGEEGGEVEWKCHLYVWMCKRI